jgi:hypothetical protein
LEIQCSKPDCFWSGAPADAADHPCPTPDPALAEAPLVQDVPPGDPVPLFATKQELEHWLAEHGVYDGAGNPSNAETIEADRQYAAFLAAEKAAATPPEPPIEDPPGGSWQVAVVAQLQDRDDARQIKWLIVDEDAAELLNGFPIKAPAEETLLEWIDGGREATLWRAADLVKIAADIQAGILDEDGIEFDAAVRTADATDPEGRDAGIPSDGQRLRGHATADETDGTADEGAEPEPDDDDEAGEPLTPAALQAVEDLLEPDDGENIVQLFDAADYDKPGLQIPKIDGHSIDRIFLDFGGSVPLDRSEPSHVDLYNRVTGRGTLELWIEAKWGGTVGKPATNRDGENDIIAGRKTLRVEEIRIVDADQLGDLEALELVRAATRRAARAGVPDDQIELACIDTLAETD